MGRLLVTGGNGVIGSKLVPKLLERGWYVAAFDIAANEQSKEHGDIRDSTAIRKAVAGVEGVIHLAAVSRVGWAEEDPIKCWDVNVQGTRILLDAALAARRAPWVLFISSREVYGNPSRLPVVEDDEIAPVNTYGRSKAEGETVFADARRRGLGGACLRLPSVYGAANDIPNRVIPAFVRGSLKNEPLHITGASQLCDFLHVGDVVDGVVSTVELLRAGRNDLPTIHLASGQATSLRELAHLTRRLAHSRSEIIEQPPRSFDVRGFVGDPTRALHLLRWAPRVALKQGLERLIAEVRDSAPS